MQKREQIELLNAVALTSDQPAHQLVRGQVGTVVEVLGPDSFEVEFADDDGRTYALVALPDSALMQLHYQPVHVA